MTKVALGQFAAAPSVAANPETRHGLARDTAAARAELVVFPTSWSTRWTQ